MKNPKKNLGNSWDAPSPGSQPRNRGLRPFVSQQRGIRIATGFVSRHCWYLLSGTGRSRPRWPAPLVEPGAVFAHLLALRRRGVALAG
jgi:hypothetical protein